MPSERIELECPGCGATVKIKTVDFVDIQENPEYKAQIIEGDFFLSECEECGDLLLVEYPLTYIDADKKITIYMEPEHDDEVLENLNSLDIPTTDVDEATNYRLVGNGVQLMEKILIAEKCRDDRVIELYKFLIWDQVKEEWPDLEPGDLLYMFDEEEEYLVIWTSFNDDDEKLTISLDDEMYDEIENDYLKHKLDEKYTVSELIKTLRGMNFFHMDGIGYLPEYTRTEITDALHEEFGFRTDTEIVTEKTMKKIIRATKK